MKKVLIFLILCVVFFLTSTRNCFAYIFEENFNQSSLDLTKWNYFEDYNATINVSNGLLTMPVTFPATKIPFVYTKNEYLPNSFMLEYKFRYSALRSHGLGLILAYSNLNFDTFMTDDIQYRVFSMWQENASQNPIPLRFQVFASKCTKWVFSCPNTTTTYLSQNLNDTNEYRILITKNNNEISVIMYDDAHLTFQQFPPITLDNDIQINHILIGHPPLLELRNSQEKFWSTFNLDYIRVDSLVTEKSPIIFIPGYLASFQWDDIVNNTSTHAWEKNPLETTYNNFMATMDNLGYEKNVDFVRWHYDFRRPLPEISEKFDAFLTNFLASKPVGTKVTLIGHSFGGLVARHYIQNYTNTDIQKVITVGTPHEGVLDVYPLVAAGEPDDKLVWRKATYEAMFNLMGKDFLSRRHAVQNFLPSSTDLLPIFEDKFLKDGDGATINSSIQNQNLTVMKNSVVGSNLMTIIRGNGNDTDDYYVLTPRTFLDEIMGNWPDGKIVYAEHSPSGDGTVLVKSSNIANVDTIELANSNHGEIISKKESIKAILDAASVAYTDDKIANVTEPVTNKAIFLLLKSPAAINVKDLSTGKEIGANASDLIPDAISAYNNKFIYIPTENNKKYDIKITGTGSGEYELNIIGVEATSSASMLTFKNTTQNNQQDIFQIQYLENGNLIDLIDEEIQNPYVSLKTTLFDLNEFVATSSANLNNKTTISDKVNDLIATADLVKTLFEDKNDPTNSIRQIQNTLKETFAIRQMFDNFETEEKISTRRKTLKSLENEKQIFEIISNAVSPVSSLRSNRYITSLDFMFQKTNETLEIKNASGVLTEFQVDSFKQANDFFDLAKKEQESLLFARSFFSSEIARFFLIEASN